MLFQSLAPQYSFSAVLAHCFARSHSGAPEKLAGELATRYGGEEVVLYSRGRAALAEAIRLAVDNKGGFVGINGLTCYSVEQAVLAAGCTPVFIDIDSQTLNFGPNELEVALKAQPQLAAIVLQNHLGLPADITAIEALAKERNLKIIEDLAHSAGSHYADGREIGTVGDFTMLSFGRGKALDVVNGGALVVRNSDLKPATPTRQPSHLDSLRDRLYPLIAWKARLLYPLGIGRYVFALAFKLGLATRSADGEVDAAEGLPAWQAHLALKQLRALDKTAETRRAISDAIYAKLPESTRLVAPGNASLVRVPALVNHRSELLKKLAVAGFLLNDTWYDVPVGPPRLFGKSQFSAKACPVAADMAERLINLPTYRQLQSNELAQIAAIIAKHEETA